MIAMVALVVALIGVLLYNPKINEIGRLMFAVGLLVAVAQFGGHSVRLI